MTGLPDSGAGATVSMGTCSDITGLSANTLRGWDRRFSLGASVRTPGGHRRYTSEDVDRLRLMRMLTELGLPLGDSARHARAGEHIHVLRSLTRLGPVADAFARPKR